MTIVASAVHGGAPAGPTVSANTNSINNARAGTCDGGVRYNNDGSEDGQIATGAWSIDRDNWLDSGLPSEVWVERTINSGTLDTDDIGATRVSMSTTRELSMSITESTNSCNLTVDFYDAASSGNLLDSVTYNIEVEDFSGGE